jgi:hypothetical protein
VGGNAAVLGPSFYLTPKLVFKLNCFKRLSTHCKAIAKKLTFKIQLKSTTRELQQTSRKYPLSNKEGRVKEQRNKKIRYTKTNIKMVDVNSTLSVITTPRGNGSNTEIKR